MRAADKPAVQPPRAVAVTADSPFKPAAVRSTTGVCRNSNRVTAAVARPRHSADPAPSDGDSSLANVDIRVILTRAGKGCVGGGRSLSAPFGAAGA